MNRHIRAVTLIELVIAITLLVVVVMTVGSIQVFGRHHVLTADRRAKLQNDVSLVLEHMTRILTQAIGNEIMNGADTVVITTDQIAGNDTLKIFIDNNKNGINDYPPPVPPDPDDDDFWVAYRFRSNAAPSLRYQVWFCPRCRNEACTTCSGSTWGSNSISSQTYVLGRYIRSLVFTKPTDGSGQLNENYIDVQINACWDPDPNTPESLDNPCVDMKTRMSMPGVNIN